MANKIIGNAADLIKSAQQKAGAASGAAGSGGSQGAGALGGFAGKVAQIGVGGMAGSLGGVSGSMDPSIFNDTTTTRSPGSGGGGWGYGYGGSSGPTDGQKDAANALEAIAKYGQNDIILPAAENVFDAIGESDKMNRQLAQERERQAMGALGADWFNDVYLTLTNTSKQLRDRAGTSGYSSLAIDMDDALNRAYDSRNEENLRSLVTSINDIRNDLFSALAANANSYNQYAADVEKELREGHSDYFSQMFNNSPEIATGEEDGFESLFDKSDEGNWKVSPADWMVSDFYKEHKAQAPDITWQPYALRPATARQSAAEAGMGSPVRNSSSAANNRIKYQQRISEDYGQRDR